MSAAIQNPGPAWWPNPRDVPEDMTGPYPWSLLDCGCHLRQPDFEAVLCDEHLAELNHRTIPEPDSPASDERNNHA